MCEFNSAHGQVFVSSCNPLYQPSRLPSSRLFGLTAVIATDCGEPTKLSVFPGILYVNYVSPGLLVMLLLVLATDLRLWLFTPVSWGLSSRW